MAGFLFALTLVFFAGGGINAENAGKTGLYAESPQAIVEDVVDSVKIAYTTSGPITQDIYEQRFND